MELGVLIYAGLPLEEEQQAFRDQNLLVQRPSASMAHTFDRRSPAVQIARELLTRVPQFVDNVEMVENSLGKHNPKLLTFSTLVSATKLMFPNAGYARDLELLTNWAITFWSEVAANLPDDLWQAVNKTERRQQREESLAVSAVVIQAFGKMARELYLEGACAEELPRYLAGLQKLNWCRNYPLWQERGVCQPGAWGLVIQNTRTTVDACYRLLCEFVGILPTGGC